MTDLVYRQDAIDALGERPIVWTDDDQYTLGERNQYDIDRLAIETLPSAQPEQKKGHWIDEGTNYSCSECYRGCWVNSDYCPWCGARMDGEEG